MTRVRTVFFGSGRFGIESLRRLATSPEVELVGVVTAPPRPAGRTRTPTPTPIDEAAQELGVATILRPVRLRAADAVASVLGLEPALAVLADYGQLVPPPILELPLGALNLHPSLLPRHRGATPIQATILSGDRETGVTLFRMDEGLDTGPIVAASTVGLDGTETAPGLEDDLALRAAEVLTASLGPWARGELVARPQPAEGATLTRTLRREDGRLDPARSADELARQVRALQPWPGSFVDGPNGRLVVWAAQPVASTVPPGGAPDGTPGRLVADGDGIALTTADGRLRLLEVQPAGGRRMAAPAYRRGRPGVVEVG